MLVQLDLFLRNKFSQFFNFLAIFCAVLSEESILHFPCSTQILSSFFLPDQPIASPVVAAIVGMKRNIRIPRFPISDLHVCFSIGKFFLRRLSPFKDVVEMLSVFQCLHNV